MGGDSVVVVGGSSNFAMHACMVGLDWGFIRGVDLSLLRKFKYRTVRTAEDTVV
jgi:hypothetical protein